MYTQYMPETANTNTRRRGLIAIVIVILFVYAYRMYKKKKNNKDEPTSSGFLSSLKSKNKKKVEFKEDISAGGEVNKDKINKLIKEIMLKQIPQ